MRESTEDVHFFSSLSRILLLPEVESQLKVMLRAKQLTNLSSNARSFFISGSRGCAADGSCSCPDDEGCRSKRPHSRTSAYLAQNPSTLTSRTPPVNVGSSVLGNTVKQLASQNDEIGDRTVSLSQARPAPTSLGKPGSVSYACGVDAVEKDMAGSLSVKSDQFLKAGMAAVGYLSDLVNYRVPVDVSGQGSVQTCVVDSARTVPVVRSSNVKVVRREDFVNVYPKAPAEASSLPNAAGNHSNSKDVGSKPASERGSKQVSSYDASQSWESRQSSSGVYDRRRNASQKPRAQHNRVTPDLTDAKVVEQFAKGCRKTSRDYSGPPTAMPMHRQFTRSSGNLVENVSLILRQLRWGSAAEEALEHLNSPMDAYQANQVLKQLQDHTVALGFFNWLKRQPGFKHDGHTYTTMTGILGRAKQFVTINKLLVQMVRDGCHPNVVTYNRLIHSYGRANYLSDAVAVFYQMQKEGCTPDRVTYCTLIDIHAKAGYLDFAMDMYRRMQAAGLSPDTFTYSVMINCLGKAGNLVAASNLFGEMVEHGCTPNLVTYNIMIALQARAKNYQSALKLYRDMQNAGFAPDKVTYSIVMEVLGHCGYLDEAESVFFEMRHKNLVPDEPVYGLLVDLWGKSGNVEKAWDWYQAMLQTGLRPNVPTCNSLLNAFLRVHRLKDAYNLLQSMVGLGLSPSLQTYTLLLSFCTDAQSPHDMGFCGELMAVTGHPAHMFLLSMPSSGPDGQNVRDHASKFLDLMHSEDRESKRGLVDAVVDFLHKSGLKEEAGSVWEVAAEKNVYPDAVKQKSSCYWLINLHVMSDGTAITALSRTLSWFRQQMLISGVSPSRIDIVTGWGRRSRVTGTSMVRQAVQELLNIFSFPFFMENGNSGCFVGCGEPLNRWLLQSYVDRMHLL